MSSEDPRDLARRLAEQAKQRMSSVPPHLEAPDPIPPPPGGETLAGGDEEESADTWNEVLDDPPEPEIVISQGAPAAERAVGAQAGARRMSALDALNAARENERRGAAAARSAAPGPVPVSHWASRSTGADGLLGEAFPGAMVESTAPVANIEVFKAVWRAHRNRAIHARDATLIATASVLLDAAERLRPGALVASSVALGAERWAVWTDADRQAVLAVATPPEVYLAG